MFYTRDILTSVRRIASVVLVCAIAGVCVTGSVAAPADAPSDPYTHDADAAAGDTQPDWITDANPHFSWINNLGAAVDAQQVQVAESADDVDSDVVGHWRFDGNGTDASGNGRTATLGSAPNDPAFIAGKTGWGQALRFDVGTGGGTASDHVSVADHTSLRLPNNFTLEAWIRATTIQTMNENFIINKGPKDWHNYVLRLLDNSSTDGRAECYVDWDDDFVAQGPDVVDGNWHHLACTWNNATNTVALYVDGALADSGTYTETPTTGNDPVYIGNMAPNEDNVFPGDIDEVRIWKRDLTGPEVAQLYADGTPGPPPYPETAGSVIWDSNPGATGEPLDIPCVDQARCEDIVFDVDGNPGSATPLQIGGHRYFVRARFQEQGSSNWSSWSDWDWFETAANNGPPAGMYTGNASAAQGFQNATEISSATPHFSWLNQTGEDVDAHHTQVYSSGLDGVMALYHLDGDAVDASGNLGNGAVSGSVAWPAGQYDTAIGMTGASQYVTIPNFESSSFTIEFWTYLDTCSGDGSTYIVASKSPNSSSTDGPWVIEFDCNGAMDPLDCQGETTTDEYEVASNFGTVTGQWVHYACVVDGNANEVRLYRNGELDNAESFPGTVVHNSNDVSYLGRRRYTGGSGAGYYKGRIDEVRLSNVARSAEQIRSAYHAGYPHHTLMWDSGQGVAFEGSCAHHTRCEDIVYGVDGNPGTALPLLPDDVRYEARSRYRTAPGGTWSDWSNWDWFETSQPVAQPTAQHTHNDDAFDGDTRPSNITSATPHFSWFNNAGEAVDRQQVQVVNDTLDNVVGLWRLDGDASDAGPNQLNGTLGTGAAEPTAVARGDEFGMAYSFDGNDEITVDDDPLLDLDSDFAIDLWFQADDLLASEYPIMLYKGDGTGCPFNCSYSLEWSQSSGYLSAYIAGPTDHREASFDATALVGDGAWHHVAMSVSADRRLRLYVDGALKDETTPLGEPMRVTAGPLRIGYSPLYPYGGELDEVRVLDRALTGPEILGYVRSARPHYTTMWESANHTGQPLDVSCGDAGRCEDIVFDVDGNAGSALALEYPDARYYARARFKTEAGDAWSTWSDWDWFETFEDPSTISVTVDTALLDYGVAVPPATLVDSADIEVITDYANGYSLAATDSSNDWALSCVCGGQLDDLTALGEPPEVWDPAGPNAYGFAGLTVRDAPGGRDPKWGTGTGTAENDYTNNKYTGLQNDTSVVLHTSDQPTASDTITTTYRIAPPATAPVGTYNGTITFTATGIP